MQFVNDLVFAASDCCKVQSSGDQMQREQTCRISSAWDYIVFIWMRRRFDLLKQDFWFHCKYFSSVFISYRRKPNKKNFFWLELWFFCLLALLCFLISHENKKAISSNFRPVVLLPFTVSFFLSALPSFFLSLCFFFYFLCLAKEKHVCSLLSRVHKEVL